MSMRRRLLPLFLAAGAVQLAGPAWADTASARPRLQPLKTDRPPVVDGVLDDEVWAKAPMVTDFRTFIPEFGKAQPERTEVYMAYDAENLYFAFRCLDPDAKRIKAAVSRRDDLGGDDFVCINLDTFGDQQSLYAFYVNPLGVQADSRFANNKEDFGVDMVWESAARLDGKGYTVEIRIPLKSIRYNAADVVRMAAFFERNINRRQEHGSFPAMDPKRGYAFMPQMAVLEYPGLRGGTLLELLPALTYSRRAEREEGEWRHPHPKAEASLTAKVGLTPSLVLDATLNPDFSQVEADAGQVDANLRYGLFFAEKRPFFLEGSELFNTGATQNSPLTTLVHTRTIVDPRFGVKLSGKLAPRDTVAALAASDRGPEPPEGAPAPPEADVQVYRYQRATWEDGYLGAFYTRRAQGPRLNQVAGPDGVFRVGPGDTLSFHAFGSTTRTDPAPDPARGRALGLEYVRDTSTLGALVSVHDVTRAFQADSGYLTRAGLTSWSGSLTPKIYPGLSWLRRLDANLGFTGSRDQYANLREHDATAGFTGILPGNGALAFAVHGATEVFLGRAFDTSGWNASLREQLTKRLAFNASYRRGRAIRYVQDPFQGRGSQASAAATYQPTENLNLNLTWTSADLYREDSGAKVYDVHITRGKVVYQVNTYLFFRGIAEYNSYNRSLLTDLLASFTYIPGTVLFVGYGTLQKRQAWDSALGVHRPAENLQEVQRGLFIKASYLWRL